MTSLPIARIPSPHWEIVRTVVGYSQHDGRRPRRSLLMVLQLRENGQSSCLLEDTRCVMMGLCWAHHQPYPPSSSHKSTVAHEAWTGAPLLASKGAGVLESVILDLAFATHVDHPGSRDPLPGAVRQRVVLQSDGGLVPPRRGRGGGDGERGRVQGQEGKWRVVCGRKHRGTGIGFSDS